MRDGRSSAARALLEKDWRRARLVLAQCALSQAAVMFFLGALDPYPPRDPITRFAVLGAFLVQFGNLAISPLLVWHRLWVAEQSDGTVSYLWSLPASRGRLWRCKVGLSATLNVAFFLLFAILALYGYSAPDTRSSLKVVEGGEAFRLLALSEALVQARSAFTVSPDLWFVLDRITSSSGNVSNLATVLLCGLVAMLLNLTLGVWSWNLFDNRVLGRDLNFRGPPNWSGGFEQILVLLVTLLVTLLLFTTAATDAGLGMIGNAIPLALVLLMLYACFLSGYHSFTNTYLTTRRIGNRYLPAVLSAMLISSVLTGWGYLASASSNPMVRRAGYWLSRPWSHERYVDTLPGVLAGNGAALSEEVHNAYARILLEPLRYADLVRLGSAWEGLLEGAGKPNRRLALNLLTLVAPADDRLMPRVLGADGGRIDPDDQPEEVAWWLVGLARPETVHRLIESKIRSTGLDDRRLAMALLLWFPAAGADQGTERARAVLDSLARVCGETLGETGRPPGKKRFEMADTLLREHLAALEGLTLDECELRLPWIPERRPFEYPCVRTQEKLAGYWRRVVGRQEAQGWNFTEAFNRMLKDRGRVGWQVADAGEITLEEFQQLKRGSFGELDRQSLGGPSTSLLVAQETAVAVACLKRHPEARDRVSKYHYLRPGSRWNYMEISSTCSP